MRRDIHASDVKGLRDAVLRDPAGHGFAWTWDPGLAAGQSNVAAANRQQYWRVRQGGSVSSLIVYVAVQSGNICAAVYAAKGRGRNAVPGPRIATTGSIACPAVGEAVLDLGLTSPLDITAGDFFFALSSDNTTAQFATTNANSQWFPEGSGGYEDTAFPSPATAGSLSPSNRPMIIVGA